MSGFEWFLVIVVVILVPLAIAVGVTLWTLEMARQRNRRNRPDPKPTGVARKATRPAERSSAVPMAADADCGGRAEVGKLSHREMDQAVGMIRAEKRSASSGMGVRDR